MDHSREQLGGLNMNKEEKNKIIMDESIWTKNRNAEEWEEGWEEMARSRENDIAILPKLEAMSPHGSHNMLGEL